MSVICPAHGNSASVLGLAVGVFFGEMAKTLQIVGDAFIMLLQMTVIPYILVSLITALGRLTLDEARLLGIKAGGVLLLLWGVGVAIVLLSPLAFPEWPSASFFSTSQVAEAKSVDRMLSAISSGYDIPPREGLKIVFPQLLKATYGRV